jgi:serine/threonine protein kinase
MAFPPSSSSFNLTPSAMSLATTGGAPFLIGHIGMPGPLPSSDHVSLGGPRWGSMPELPPPGVLPLTLPFGNNTGLSLSASSSSFFLPSSFSSYSDGQQSDDLNTHTIPQFPNGRRSSKSTSSTPRSSHSHSRKLRRRSFSNGDGSTSGGNTPHSLSVISENISGQPNWAPSFTSVSEQSSPSSPVEYYSMPPPKRRSAPTSPMSSNTTPSSSLSSSLLALQLNNATLNQQHQHKHRSLSAGTGSGFPAAFSSRSPSSSFEPLEPGKRKQRSRAQSPEDPSPLSGTASVGLVRSCLLNRATVTVLETFQNIQASILRSGSSSTVDESSKPPGEAATAVPVLRQHHHSNAPYYPVRVNEILQNGRYRVVSLLGRGVFGIVVRALVIDDSAAPNTEVAIKILRKGASFLAQGKREWQVLQYIRKHQSPTDESQNFLVNALDCFFQNEHFCIVFELLSDTLYELLQRSWAMAATPASGVSAPPARPGLSLRMVCKMAHQLLCALVTLRGLRIIHADLKPENVALTSPNRPRIKLLDFGSCCFASEEASNQFPYIQSRYYRAPEVLLGTGYGCEIDMWSFGCVVVELYLGKPLFIGDTTTQQLYKIMDVIDAPPDVIIRQSAHWSRFFKKAANPIHPIHGLGGYERLVGHDASSADLRTLITSKQEPNQPQHIEYFVDFVERILRWDPTTRMTPLDALNHNFILHGPRGLAPGSAAPPRQ